MATKMKRAPRGELGGYDMTEVGHFYWDVRNGNRVLCLMIPASDTRDGCVYSRWPILPHRTSKGAGWEWDGNEHEPTLSPSLHAINIWHGHVQNGVIL